MFAAAVSAAAWSLAHKWDPPDGNTSARSTTERGPSETSRREADGTVCKRKAASAAYPGHTAPCLAQRALLSHLEEWRAQRSSRFGGNVNRRITDLENTPCLGEKAARRKAQLASISSAGSCLQSWRHRDALVQTSVRGQALSSGLPPAVLSPPSWQFLRFIISLASQRDLAECRSACVLSPQAHGVPPLPASCKSIQRVFYGHDVCVLAVWNHNVLPIGEKFNFALNSTITKPISFYILDSKSKRHEVSCAELKWFLKANLAGNKSSFWKASSLSIHSTSSTLLKYANRQEKSFFEKISEMCEF